MEKGKHYFLVELLQKKSGGFPLEISEKIARLKNGDIDEVFLKAYDSLTLKDIFSE